MLARSSEFQLCFSHFNGRELEHFEAQRSSLAGNKT